MKFWRGAIVLGLLVGLSACATAPAPASANAALVDPPRDTAHPAINRQLLIPSHGERMNAVFFLAAGDEPKPTMLLMHGLPGNERNLDLAQAIRRAGWNVLTFTYRGAWGSTGAFSIANSVEDTRRSPMCAARTSPRSMAWTLVASCLRDTRWAASPLP